MLLIYNIALQLYFLAICAAALFNKKAKLWVNGRKHQNYIKYEQSIWFHFASLGEFEQGRPVLEKMREMYPKKEIVITFFSPSGFEIRKNTPLADAVYYLPLDTAANARKFISAINPAVVIFTKYEYWYHFYNELYKRDVPLYVISGIFRPKQIFFKWYGGLHRKILSFVTRFFVQDEQSVQLLQSIGLSNATISGDTRFDRVWANAQQPKELPMIQQFVNGQKTFIAGSTWPEDEKLVAALPTQYPDWKFIIAPHEISEEKISRLIDLLPENSAIRFSQFSNTLEDAAFGLQVIFGPNYSKFKEAKDLVSLECGFSINNETELISTVKFLSGDDEQYEAISKKTKDYVRDNTGATDTILEYVNID